MKFIVDALDLSEGLLKVSKAVAVRTTVAVLECILMKAENDGVTLLATDGELSIQKKIKADVLEEGEICVPGKTFTDFICKLIGQSISVQTEKNTMEIKYGDNSTSFQVLSTEDFPVIDLDIKENSYTITKEGFKEVVARTAFCCASDDSRPILKGALYQAEGNELTVTALDGFRMAVVKAPIISSTGKLKMVCPCRTLSEISRLLEGEEETLTVYTEKGMMMVKIEDTYVLSRLYQGEFIDYKSITPPDFTTKVYVKKAELTECIERAGVLIRGDKNNLVIFEIKPGNITISSNSEMGKFSEKVSSILDGKELKIAMNSKYILDAVKATDDEEILISFNSAISPFILTKHDDNECFYLILPVRTNS